MKLGRPKQRKGAMTHWSVNLMLLTVAVNEMKAICCY